MVEEGVKLERRSMLKLDLGCGGSCREGYTGVDCLQLDGVSVVHDLNRFPYPFDEGSVDDIWLDQVIEHLSSPLRVAEELFRMCKDRATVRIGVPYFRSRYMAIDPTHVTAFSVDSFSYFDPDSPLCQRYQYTDARFRIEKIEFDREWREKKSFRNLLHRMMVKLANRYPVAYEERLSHLYPLNSLTFTLVAIKNSE
ncbi:MAG: SAM-dependent methyltransferase [Planctomycetaceae bacterium]|nr:SAM-dependent methyltransferase [Planctomycetaceae bacterium]